MESEITKLGHYRMLSAQRRMVAAVVERVSKISCDVHEQTVRTIGAVDDDGSRMYRYSEKPCCARYAAILQVSRDKIERELYEPTGYLRALRIDDDPAYV